MPPRPLRDRRSPSVRLAEVAQKLRSREYTAELAALALTDISKAADQENMELFVAFSDLIKMLNRRNTNVEMALQRLDDLHRTLIKLESPERSPIVDPTTLPDNSPPPPPMRGALDDTVSIDEGTARFFDLGRSEEADPQGSWVGPTRKPPTTNPDPEIVPPPKKGSARFHLAGAPTDPPILPPPVIVLPRIKTSRFRWSYLAAGILFITICVGMKLFVDWPKPTEPSTPTVVIAEPPPPSVPETIAEVIITETCDATEETAPPPAPPVTVTASVSKTVITPPPAAITRPSAAITEGTAFLILRDDQSRRGQWIFDGIAVTPDGHVLYHGAPMPETCLQVKAPGAYRASKACPARELLYWFDD